MRYFNEFKRVNIIITYFVLILFFSPIIHNRISNAEKVSLKNNDNEKKQVVDVNSNKRRNSETNSYSENNKKLKITDENNEEESNDRDYDRNDGKFNFSRGTMPRFIVKFMSGVF
jgi:hypothetical protein